MDKAKVDILREAVPYIKRFKGRIFVVKLGGRVVEDTDALHALSEEIALLDEVGIRVVVVHGGGKQATELSAKLGIEPRFVGGRRITDDATLDVAKMVYAGQVSVEILSALRREEVEGVGLSGVDGNMISARRRPHKFLKDPETGRRQKVDFGHVGDIINVNPRLILCLLQNEYVPVIACLGADERGNIFNINADTIACEIAVGLKAEKLIMMSDVEGLYLDMKDPSTLVSKLTVKEARALVRKKVITAGMIPKILASINVVERGVGSAHIISGKSRNSLLFEVFTDEGSGTMVTTGAERPAATTVVVPSGKNGK